MLSRRQAISVLSAAAGAPLFAHAASAQTYPARPVKLVVPFPPGGVNDTVGRPWAEKMRAPFGSIVIENVGGAGGGVGSANVARAAPDGYTLLLAPEATLLVTPIASKHPTYDWKSYEPVASLVKSAVGFIAHPSAPFRTLQELAVLAKSKSANLSYATPGVGTSNHLVVELFKSLVGAPDLTHVPYRGAGPALNDLIGGQIQLGTVVVTGHVLGLHRAKRLQLFAVSSPTRLQAAPDVPTAAEEGFPSLVWVGFHGIFAPAKTDGAIVNRLADASRIAMVDSALQRFFLDSGLEPDLASTPDGVRRTLAEEVERWTPVIKGLGLQVD